MRNIDIIPMITTIGPDRRSSGIWLDGSRSQVILRVVLALAWMLALITVIGLVWGIWLGIDEAALRGGLSR